LRFNTFTTFETANQCAFFNGYYPIAEVNEYIGCKFSKSQDQLRKWVDSVSFAEYAAACQIDGNDNN